MMHWLAAWFPGRSKHSSARVSVRSGYTITVLRSFWASMKNSPRVKCASPAADYWVERQCWHTEIWTSSAEGPATINSTPDMSNKLSTKWGEENGSWQLVRKKQHHCKRHCSQHGATQTTEARACSGVLRHGWTGKCYLVTYFRN